MVKQTTNGELVIHLSKNTHFYKRLSIILKLKRIIKK